MADQTITVTADTYLDEGANNSNRSSVNNMQLRAGGVNEDNLILQFDVTSLSGKMWDSVKLNLTYSDIDSSYTDPASAGLVFLAFIKRAVVVAQCTWDEFETSGPTSWSSGGAENGTDNNHTTRVSWTDLQTTHVASELVASPDITEIVKQALFENAGTLFLIVYATGASGGLQRYDTLQTSGGVVATLELVNVEDMESTSSSNPGGTAANVPVPSASSLSKSGRPPIAGADRQYSATILHDGVEPMNILSITLRGTFGADN